MPSPFYLTIKGERQGDISKDAYTADSVGNKYQEGHENECLCQALLTDIQVPRDPQSGQPTGQRVHGPATIIKDYDKTSPLLHAAIASGEVLEMEAKFYRTNVQGKQEHYYTIKWTDAILVKASKVVKHCRDLENQNHDHEEEYQFTYRKVDWTHEKCGTTGSDDWRKPLSG